MSQSAGERALLSGYHLAAEVASPAHRAVQSADVLPSVDRSRCGEAGTTFRPSWKSTLVEALIHPDGAGWGLSSPFIAAI